MTDQSTPASLFNRLDYSLVAPETPTDPADPKPVGPNDWFQTWKKIRPLVDGVATLLWAYVLAKVFVADIDRSLLGGLADYRFFLFLAILLAVVLSLRKPGRIIAILAYMLFFPLVVVGWKFPKVLIKTRSPVLFIAVVNAIASLVSDLRHTVIVASLVAFSALVIAISTADWLLGIAATIMGGFVLQAIFRTVKLSVMPSRFLKMQQDVIHRAVESNTVRKLVSPSDELLKPEIEKFTPEQQTAFLNNVGGSVLAHRVLYYWAFQLQCYSRSAATWVFSALSYLWLVARVVFGLAFVNLAVYHANEAAFSFESEPSFLDFARCTIAALYGGEIAAIQPRNDLADAVAIATFVVGWAILGGVVAAVIQSRRTSRTEDEIRETVQGIKREGGRLERTFEEVYDVSVPDAIKKLEELKYALVGLVTFFSTRIPEDFEDDRRS